MATFAEYHQQTMATNNDFTLYPSQDLWNADGTYLQNGAAYANQSYANTNTVDTFPQHFNMHSYSHNPTYGQKTVKCGRSPATPASNSFDLQQPPMLSSYSDAGASAASSISSATGSPSLHPQIHNEWFSRPEMAVHSGMMGYDSLGSEMFVSTDHNLDAIAVPEKGCVDPALIQPYSPTSFNGVSYPDTHAPSPRPFPFTHAPSPAPSKTSIRSPELSGQLGHSHLAFPQNQSWQPYPTFPAIVRRNSISSVHSHHSSQGSLASEESNKGPCPIPTCGRHVKDLRSHMMTHRSERPEKCPIPNCEYHIKGFARKYDKNRHTLTHYKGTMVCDFCPGSGSAAEKSFNRADVFKRHLTSVHGVEQTPPNARRKSPATTNNKRNFGTRDVSGTCSTCSVTFASAQDFYEHLDDCVLRVVQQVDPAEAINETLLSSVADDKEMLESLERHRLPTSIDYNVSTAFDDDDDDDEAEDDAETIDDGAANYNPGARSSKSGKGALKSRKGPNSQGQSTQPRSVCVSHHIGGGKYDPTHGAVSKVKRGLTYSREGVSLVDPLTKGGNRRRKNYPVSWTAAPAQMKMRKRVLCVFDGPRRLWKDDMMLDADHEVRVPLQGVGDGRAWVTDLDVQTIARAEGFHNATEEEKGPWIEDEDALERLMR